MQIKLAVSNKFVYRFGELLAIAGPKNDISVADDFVITRRLSEFAKVAHEFRESYPIIFANILNDRCLNFASLG